MSHDRGCFKCHEDRWNYKYCQYEDCPKRDNIVGEQMSRQEIIHTANGDDVKNLMFAERQIRVGLDILMDISMETALSKGFCEPGTLNGTPEVHIGLIHTEVSEVMEAMRRPQPAASKKIPDFPETAEELADVVIRCCILARLLSVDLSGAVTAKGEYNRSRPMKHGGKRF